jgi:membrane associated rhomboid family serine protease
VNFRSEIRDSPATYGLVASWILTYILMNLWQGGFISEGEWFTGFGAVRTDTTHLFGDLTWRDFSHGQVWRALTATFIHFSFTHLLLNAIGMIQLGRMMEEWYGSRQFLAISLTLGGLGNVLGVLMRQAGDFSILWIQAHGMGRVLPSLLVEAAVPGQAQVVPSAGGSTIILGLIGLGLVVGWRSRTRVGLFLRDQMFGFLVFTAVIGVFCMKFMDNYGHAGGAIAGMAVGFLHRPLVRTEPRGRTRRLIAIATGIVVLACFGEQFLTDRHELAVARREAVKRESLLQINLCGILGQVLRALSVEFESIAYQRLGQALPSIGDPRASRPETPLDYSPIAAFTNQIPPWQPQGPNRRELLAFSRGIAGLAEIRTAIDHRVDGPEFDEILAIGTAITQGSVDSNAIYAFRLACLTVAKRAAKLRDTLLNESQQ